MLFFSRSDSSAKRLRDARKRAAKAAAAVHQKRRAALARVCVVAFVFAVILSGMHTIRGAVKPSGVVLTELRERSKQSSSSSPTAAAAAAVATRIDNVRGGARGEEKQTTKDVNKSSSAVVVDKGRRNGSTDSGMSSSQRDTQPQLQSQPQPQVQLVAWEQVDQITFDASNVTVPQSFSTAVDVGVSSKPDGNSNRNNNNNNGGSTAPFALTNNNNNNTFKASSASSPSSSSSSSSSSASVHSSAFSRNDNGVADGDRRHGHQRDTVPLATTPRQQQPQNGNHNGRQGGVDSDVEDVTASARLDDNGNEDRGPSHSNSEIDRNRSSHTDHVLQRDAITRSGGSVNDNDINDNNNAVNKNSNHKDDIGDDMALRHRVEPCRKGGQIQVRCL